jgi:thioredoxin-related protein
MRKIVYAFAFCLFANQISYSQDMVTTDEGFSEVREIKLNWMPNYKKALKKSKKERKPVLIYFTGSDWCGPCKILDRDLFHTEKFKTLSDKDLVLLEVNIPRRLDIISPEKMIENKSIQKKYKVKAFPTLMIVNHKGRKIAEKKGYIMTEYYYPFFQSQIDRY